MKTRSWKQNVLLVSGDVQLQKTVTKAFGGETDLVIAGASDKAIEWLSVRQFQVLIIDVNTTDPKLQYFDEKTTVSFLEVSQYASQLNQGLTIVVLTNKLLSKDGDFARKCGAALIMDRKNISLDLMIYIIRVLRKRTFRTVLSRDFQADQIFSVTLYHYLPSNERFAVFLQPGVPFSAQKRESLAASHVRHLYVKEPDLPAFFGVLRRSQHGVFFSEELAAVRNQFRQLLIQFFDSSTDGSIHFGREMLGQAVAIVDHLEKLVNLYPDPRACLRELPYPRWSAIAHGINCVIYSLVFSRVCELGQVHEIALAALIHNVGLSGVRQEILRAKEADMNPRDLAEYRMHVTKSLELIHQKQMPSTPLVANIIRHHHENFDGSGYPDGLRGPGLSIEASFVSMIASFDYFNTVRPGDTARSPVEAWQLVKEEHLGPEQKTVKFHPALINWLDPFFASLLVR